MLLLEFRRTSGHAARCAAQMARAICPFLVRRAAVLLDLGLIRPKSDKLLSPRNITQPVGNNSAGRRITQPVGNN